MLQPGGAARAHRLVGLQEPDPHLEAEVVAEQRAHRADVGQVAGVVVGDRPVLEGRDLGVVAAVHELEEVRAGDLVLEADAARAQHAPLGVEHDRAQVHHLALVDLVLDLDLGVVEAVPHVLVLQVALAGLVADRAVDGVVDQQELERRPVGLGRLLGVRVDHHAVPSTCGVAGDLELGHLLDLDQAHAAVAVHGEVRVPAEAGDADPELLRGLDDGGPVRDLDLPAVDGALGHVAHRSSSPAMTFSPPMVATASASISPRIMCGEGLVDVVAGRPDLHPPGVLLAVAHDVVAELAVGALGVAVDLAGRRAGCPRRSA